MNATRALRRRSAEGTAGAEVTARGALKRPRGARMRCRRYIVTLQVRQYLYATFDLVRRYGDDLPTDAFKLQIDARWTHRQVADA